MTDVLASEWLKLRTVRSTYYVLLAVLLLVALGAALTWAGVDGWDKLTPARRAHFQATPMEQVILPAVQFALAVLGALSITSEYATGMIRTSLTAVPGRRQLLAAKAVVAGSLALAAGLAAEFAMFFAGRLIIGNRPIPGNTGALIHQVPRVAFLGLSVMVIALVALGLGTVLRSTAGALTSVAALLFVVPVLAHFLPAPWSQRIAAVLPSGLPLQLAHTASRAVLSPPWALAILIAYIAAALLAGASLIARRDA
jgi:ABC-type transport system involved in multi-copper enzyme maturation permease subunit